MATRRRLRSLRRPGPVRSRARALILLLTMFGASNPSLDAAPAGAGPVLRGDLDGDSVLSISDAVRILHAIFRGPADLPCEDAANVNADARLDLSDAVFLLEHLFRGGPEPAPAYAVCAPEAPEPGDDSGDLLTRITTRESRALPAFTGGGAEFEGATPIELGQVVAGEITSRVLPESYSFRAEHGTWVTLDRVASSNAAGLNWTLSDRWGRILASQSSSLDDLGPVPLLGGEYLVTVLPEGSGLGSYEFRVVDATPVVRSIVPGEVVTAAIPADRPGQRHLYDLAVDPGETVFLDLVSTESSALYWELSDAFGRVIFPSSRLGGLGPVRLLGGEYRLAVEGRVSLGNLATGAYEFRVVSVPDASMVDIALGDVVAGEIVAPGEVDEYRFTVPTEGPVFIDLLATDNTAGLNFELVDARDRAILPRTGFLGDQGPVALSAGGYRLRVLSEGGATGSYELRVVDAALGEASISVGVEVTGEVAADRPGSGWIYDLNVPSSRVVRIELLETSNLGGLNWRLEDGHGRSVLARTNSLTSSPDLPLVGGDYRLAVLGERDQTGTFRFLVEDRGPATYLPAGEPIVAGETVASAVPTPGGEVVYTFDAAEGQRYYVDLIVGDGNLDWELIDPVGAVVEATRASNVSSSDLGPVSLAAGRYSIRIASRSASAAPAYEFVLREATRATVDVSVGDVVSGAFSDDVGGAGDVDVYRFPVADGDTVFLDRLDSGGRIEWTLEGPEGTAVFGLVRSDGASGDQGPFTLTGGTYSLVIDPPSGTPSYEVRISSVVDFEQVVAPGETVTLDFTGRAGAVEVLRIDVASGQRLYLPSVASGSAVDWTLLDPEGEAVFGPVRADRGGPHEDPVPLAAGRYSLLVDPADGGEPVFDVTVASPGDVEIPLEAGVAVSGTPEPGGVLAYTFDSVDGGRWLLDLEEGFRDLRWSLFDELGEAVFRDRGTAGLFGGTVDQGPLNLAAGSYRLLLSPTDDTPPTVSFVAHELPVDLAVAELSASPAVVFESERPRSVEVEWVVENLGGGPALAAPTVDRWVLSEDLTVGNGDDLVLVEFVRFGELPPHGRYARAETIVLPDSVPIGDYRLFLVVDAEDAATEPGAEEDNQASIQVSIVEDLPPAEPGFITTTTFPLDFTAEPGSLAIDLPLSRPVDLDSIRFVHGEALRIQLSRPGGLGAESRISMALLSGSTEVLEISESAPSTGGAVATFVSRFSRRLSPQVVARLATRTVDGVRLRFDQPSTTKTDVSSIHQDGRLRVHFASCEFTPCGPHQERRPSDIEPITVDEPGTSEWQVVLFEDPVPADGLRFVSGPQFTATVTGSIFFPSRSTSEAQLLLDDGGLLTLDDWKAPSDLSDPDVSICADHSLGIEPGALAGRSILGFQWRVHTGSFTGSAFYDAIDETSLRFLYETERCDGPLAIPPVELTPADGSVFPPGSRVTLSGRAFVPEPGRPVSAVLVNGRAVESLDASGRFFTTVTVDAGDNLFVIEVTEPGCGTYETLLRLEGLTDGTRGGLSGYDEVSARLRVEYSETTFVRAADQLVVKARARNVSDHAVRGPVVMALTGLRDPSVTLRSAAGFTDDGAPYVVMLAEGTLAPGEVGDWVPLAFGNVERAPVRFDVRWLAPEDRPPRFESAPPASAVVDAEYSYPALASDPDGDAVGYELASGPAGMTVDPAAGILLWTPGLDDLGNHDVVLAARDGVGGEAVQRWTITVSAAPVNRPPYFTSIPRTSAPIGSRYTYGAVAADPEGDALTFSLLEGPAGITVDPTSGLVAWEFALPGAHPITVEVDDGAGGVAAQSYTLGVGAVPSNPSAPGITTSPTPQASIGVLWVYQPVVVDPDGDPPIFSLEGAPTGMDLDAASGRVEWLPSDGQEGTYALTLVVRDGRGGETRQSFEIRVGGSDSNLPPVIESIPPGHALVGETLRYAIEAVDPEGGSLQHALAAGPAGAGVGPADGVLEWTPGAGDVGSHAFGVRATDPEGASGSQAFEVVVRASNAAPEITSDEPPTSVVAGATFQHDIDATDADGDLVRYEIVEAPGAMTVQPITGLVTWETGPDDEGPHPILVRAVDCCGGAVDVAFTLDVTPDTEPPTASIAFDANPVDVGAEVEVFVNASDDARVASRTLTVQSGAGDATELLLDEVARATFRSTEAAFCVFEATVLDTSGNETVASAVLRVGDPEDPLDPHPPVVEILAPLPGSVITAPVDLVATITDATPAGEPGSGPITWTVELGGPADEELETIATGEGAGTALPLATIDPTLLANGTYRVRVVAADTVQTGGVEFQLHVGGDLKQGNLSVSFTDLTVPLSGISLRISRRYDSLDPTPGDFGAAWRLALPGDVSDSPEESDTGSGLVDLLSSEPMGGGARVYVTRPDGRRVGFTFQARSAGGLLAMFWFPMFEPDPGVTDRLEVVEPAGAFFYVGGKASQVGVPYNPTVYALTTREGVRYTISEDDGLLGVEDPSGNTIDVTEDGLVSSLGPAVRFERDAAGRITRLLEPVEEPGDPAAAHEYTYDDRGNLTSYLDPSGRLTEYRYDDERHPHHLTEVDGPEGGATVRNVFDDAGRLVAQCLPDDDAESLEGCILYDHDPDARISTVVDGLGNRTDLILDDQGRTRLERRHLEDGGVLEIERVYDDRGLETSRRIGSGVARTREYDDEGRVVRAADSGGRVWTFEYGDCDGASRICDPGGNCTDYELDDACRVAAIVNPVGGVTRLAYDDAGGAVQLTDAEGSVWRIERDGRGRIAEVEAPDGGLSRYEYSAAGDLLLEVDPEGRRIEYEYDGAHRLVRETWDDGTVLEFEYDERGRLQRSVDPWSEALIEYWSDGRVRSVSSRLTGDAEPVTLVYGRLEGEGFVTSWDGAGKLTAVSDSLGGVTEYGYDAAGRMVSITQHGDGVRDKRVDLEYDESSVLSRSSRYDDLDRTAPSATTEREHQEPGSAERVTAIRHLRGDGGAPIHELELEYDPTGRPTTIRDAEGDHQYLHDGAGRLLEALHPAGGPQPPESYRYDLVGNRVESHRSASHRLAYAEPPAGGGNRLLEDDGFVYTWSIGGHLEERFEKATGRRISFTHDHRGRLVSMVERDAADAVLHEVRYTYDSADRRILAERDGVTTRYVYDAENPVLVLDGAGAVAERRLYGRRKDEVHAVERSGQTYWLLRDHLGTVRDLVTGAGDVHAHLVYDSFGALLESTATELPTRLGYTSRESEVVGGLVYYRARVYDPASGRFLERDPRFPFRYEYAWNSPLALNDPSGQGPALEYVVILIGIWETFGAIFCIPAPSGAFFYLLQALNRIDSGGYIPDEVDHPAAGIPCLYNILQPLLFDPWGNLIDTLS